MVIVISTLTDAANLALARLGANKIDDIENEDYPDAVLMNSMMKGTVVEVLSIFPWNCAVGRITLTESTTVENLTDYEHAYQLSSALMLKVLDIDGDRDQSYRIEGEYLFTNEGKSSDGTEDEGTFQINLRYIKYLSNPNDWDEILAEAIIVRLAEKACIKVTQNMNLAAYLQQQFLQLLQIAQQGSSKEDREDISSLIASIGNASLASMLLAKNNYATG